MKLPWQRNGAADGHARRGLPPDLPAPPYDVELRMPDGKRLHGRLAGREEDELLVLLMVPGDELASAAALRNLMIELTGRNGVIRMTGAASREGDDLLRFREICSLDILQRREYVRVRTARTVLLRIPGSLAPVESSSLDISGGGMMVGGLEHLRVGEHVDFRLTTSADAPPVTGGGVVVRSDSGGRRAIAFDRISDGNRRRLVRFLFDCLREERRKGLMTGGEDGQ